MEFGLVAKDSANGYLFYFILDIQSPNTPVFTRTRQYYILSPRGSYSRAYCFLCVCFCDLSVEPLLHQWLELYNRCFDYISYGEFLMHLLHTAKGVAHGNERYVPFTDEASARLALNNFSMNHTLNSERDAVSRHLVNTPRNGFLPSSPHHNGYVGNLHAEIGYLQRYITVLLQTQGSRTNELLAQHHGSVARLENKMQHREVTLCCTHSTATATADRECQLEQALEENRSLVARHHQALIEMERWRLECQELRHKDNLALSAPVASVSREQYEDLERRHRLLHREFDELAVEKAQTERLLLVAQQDAARRQTELDVALRALAGVGRGLDYVQRELPMLVTSEYRVSSHVT